LEKAVIGTPENTDDAFFAALLAADADALDRLLAAGFLIVNVVDGIVTGREAFIAAVRTELAQFAAIDVAERTTRIYGRTAVMVGRTTMRGTIADDPFTVQSRYTHVLVADGEAWRLASAQGTQIT
jgi:ketosteroid isomerase-like protein